MAKKSDISPLERTHLISCIGIDREIALLPYFLRHYQALGIPGDQFHILLHSWSGNAGRIAEARAVFERLGLPEPGIWCGHWSGAAHWQKRRELQQAHVLSGHWVLHADADELHEYPCDLDTFLAHCEDRDVNCVQGPMIDRVAADGSLAPIGASQPLEETFPIETDVRYLIGWQGENYGMPGTVKIMAARANILPKSGGHLPHADGATPRYLLGHGLHEMVSLQDRHFRFAVPMKVHHYKWNSGLRDSLAERRANREESPASLEFSARLDDYLARHDRIELARLPRGARSPASYLSWQRRIQWLYWQEQARRVARKIQRRLPRPLRAIST